MIRLVEIGLIALVLYYVQFLLYKRNWNRHLTARVAFKDKAIFQGEASEVQESIVNKKRLPLPMLKVRFQTDRHLIFDKEIGSRTTDKYYRNDVLHVGGGEKVVRSIPFIGGKRGYYEITEMDLVGSDLFLTREYAETLATQTSLYVYPRPLFSEEFKLLLKQLNGQIITRQHLLEDPFEYRGIREYQPYDELKSINWKATAKTGSLKVNQKNYTALPSLRIFFDIEDRGILKNEECVEATFQIAAGLASYFLGQGMRLSCYGNGLDLMTEEPLRMDSGVGKGQLEQLLISLARINTELECPDFSCLYSTEILSGSKDAFNCIIAFHQYPPFLKLIRQLKDSGKNFLWIYPSWEKEEPEIPDDLAKYVRVIHLRK